MLPHGLLISMDLLPLRTSAEVLSRAGVTGPLRSEPALRRSVDVPFLVGDNAKLRADTGWSPVRSRGDIIDDLLNAAS